MPAETAAQSRKAAAPPMRDGRLRKHADYQRVYREGKRQSLPLMTYFFAQHRLETESPIGSMEFTGSRVGLTAGRVLGNAVERNRIKRRMRESIRLHREELIANVDVILHPRRTVLQAEFSQIEREVRRAFRAVEAALAQAAMVKADDVNAAPGH